MMFLRASMVAPLFVLGMEWKYAIAHAVGALAIGAGAFWFVLVLAIWRPWKNFA